MPAATASSSQWLDCSGVRIGRMGDTAKGYGLLITLPYRPPKADFTVIDSKIETAVRIGAHPGLVGDRRALPSVVRQGYQSSLRALLTGRPLLGLHGSLPGSVRLRAAPAIHRIRRTPRQTGTHPRNRTRSLQAESPAIRLLPGGTRCAPDLRYG